MLTCCSVESGREKIQSEFARKRTNKEADDWIPSSEGASAKVQIVSFMVQYHMITSIVSCTSFLKLPNSSLLFSKI